jgi:hypothetical protein
MISAPRVLKRERVVESRDVRSNADIFARVPRLNRSDSSASLATVRAPSPKRGLSKSGAPLPSCPLLDSQTRSFTLKNNPQSRAPGRDLSIATLTAAMRLRRNSSSISISPQIEDDISPYPRSRPAAQYTSGERSHTQTMHHISSQENLHTETKIPAPRLFGTQDLKRKRRDSLVSLSEPELDKTNMVVKGYKTSQDEDSSVQLRKRVRRSLSGLWRISRDKEPTIMELEKTDSDADDDHDQVSVLCSEAQQITYLAQVSSRMSKIPQLIGKCDLGAAAILRHNNLTSSLPTTKQRRSSILATRTEHIKGIPPRKPILDTKYDVQIIASHAEFWDIPSSLDEYVPVFGGIHIRDLSFNPTRSKVILRSAPVGEVALSCAVSPLRNAAVNALEAKRNCIPRIRFAPLDWTQVTDGGWVRPLEIQVPTELFAIAETRELVLGVQACICEAGAAESVIFDQMRITVSLLSSGREMHLSDAEYDKLLLLDEDRIARAEARQEALRQQDKRRELLEEHKSIVEDGHLTAEEEEKLNAWLDSTSDEVF